MTRYVGALAGRGQGEGRGAARPSPRRERAPSRRVTSLSLASSAGGRTPLHSCASEATPEMTGYVAGLWRTRPRKDGCARDPPRRECAPATRDASLSLSLRPQLGCSPALMCENKNATPEILRYVVELWPDAIKEKDEVRARPSPRRECAPSRRVTPRSLSRFVRRITTRRRLTNSSKRRR